MNKKTLVEELAKRANISLKDSKAAVEAYQDIIIETLKRGDSVCLVNFGSFKVVERKARMGYNPATNKFVKYKAKRVPVFKFGSWLKSEIF